MRMIESRRAGYVSLMGGGGGLRKTYKFFEGKPGGRKTLQRSN
jgi:hypothetical protein